MIDAIEAMPHNWSRRTHEVLNEGLRGAHEASREMATSIYIGAALDSFAPQFGAIGTAVLDDIVEALA